MHFSLFPCDFFPFSHQKNFFGKMDSAMLTPSTSLKNTAKGKTIAKVDLKRKLVEKDEENELLVAKKPHTGNSESSGATFDVYTFATKEQIASLLNENAEIYVNYVDSDDEETFNAVPGLLVKRLSKQTVNNAHQSSGFVVAIESWLNGRKEDAEMYGKGSTRQNIEIVQRRIAEEKMAIKLGEKIMSLARQALEVAQKKEIDFLQEYGNKVLQNALLNPKEIEEDVAMKELVKQVAELKSKENELLLKIASQSFQHNK